MAEKGIMNVTRTIPNRSFLPLKSKIENEKAHSDVTITPSITVENVTKKLLKIANPKFLWTRISSKAPQYASTSNHNALAEKGINPAKIDGSFFTDETIEVDSNDKTYQDHTPFDYLFLLPQYEPFITQAYEVATNSPYYKNKVSKGEDISSIESSANNLPDPDNYTSTVPYYVTIDLTDTNSTTNIITNVFFAIDGDDKYARADFLAHAWTNTEEFAIN